MNAEEIFDKYVDVATGDELDNLDILNSYFSEEEKEEYVHYCLEHPKEKTPWHYALEKLCSDLAVFKEKEDEFEPYFILDGMDEYINPIAVIATERDANGKIIPSTIHAIVEFTMWEIVEEMIDTAIEYNNVLIDKFAIAPKVVIIGKEPSKAVQSYIAKSNLEDVTVYAIKGAEWQE